MTVRFLDLYALHSEIRPSLDEAYRRVLEGSSFISGTEVERFEDAFARFVDTPFCVGVGNGTDAIEISIEALTQRAQGEVIVPANSFIASSEAVTRAGCTVVFADVEPNSYNLDVADVAAKITQRTVGVLAVHLYGNPAPLAELRSLCDQRGLFLVEDCAQAHGATYGGAPVGTVGDAATFSFYPGKNLGALGDGGAIVTADPAVAERCRMIANHGRLAKYDHLFEGRNSRLDGLQAAFLAAKLPHVARWVDARRHVATRYDELLAGIDGLTLPPVNPCGEHAYHLYVVRHARRDQLKSFLDTHDVESGVHYPIALPDLAAYASMPAQEGLFARTAAAEVLSLPMGPHLGEGDIAAVALAVRQFAATSR